jgi:formate-nitrite transporter family protein
VTGQQKKPAGSDTRQKKGSSDPPTGNDPEKSAGAGSAQLDEDQQRQAASHASPQAIVIHEVIREEGEVEIRRSFGALFWSGTAAGLSMGFSLLTLAMLKSYLPETRWAEIVAAPGYCVGFIIVILGRQQLFTESTLTAMLPLFVQRNFSTFLAVMRLWGIVLAANLLGTTLVARLLSIPGVFDPAIFENMRHIGMEITQEGNFAGILKAIFAGWLIALMVWVLPSARSARLFVILILTFVVAVGHFPHIVAGSVEAAFAVFAGDAGISQYFTGFLLPTLLGNTIGGVALAALLNHAPLADEFSEPRPG